MALKDIKTVPAKEFKLRFGTFREAALTEPIGISNHGRVSTVMISAKEFEEFERLKQYDTRQALYANELDEELQVALDEGDLGDRDEHLDHLLD